MLIQSKNKDGYLANPNKKEAFTLIELLAVIVILAVIALIATPLIMKIIDETKRSSFKQSFMNILHAGEIANANEEFKGQTYEIVNGLVKYGNGVEGIPKVKIKGDIKNYNGVFYTNDKGYTAGYVDKGIYCAYKLVTENDATVLKTGKCKDSILGDDPTGGGLVCPSCEGAETLCPSNGYYTKEELDKAVAEAIDKEKAKNPYNGYVVKFGSKTFTEVANMKGIPLSISYKIGENYNGSDTKSGKLTITLNDGSSTTTDYLISVSLSIFNFSSIEVSGSGNLDLEKLFNGDLQKLKNIKSVSSSGSIGIREFYVISWLEPIN